MKVCLVTPAQPSTNPRLVKEADALAGMGHRVHVVAAYCADWATEADRVLVARRSWTLGYVGGHPRTARLAYAITRYRRRAAEMALRLSPGWGLVQRLALSRVTPDLERAAVAQGADLYIAHNLAALPAASRAARRVRARVAFDAEDFHAGMRLHGRPSTLEDTLVAPIEQAYLEQCSYLTAAAPGIAEAYARTYGVPMPRIILNVFPLAHRPQTWRPTRTEGPLTLYWFSQTIGRDRGLEEVVDAMARFPGQVALHLRGAWQPGYRDLLLARAQRAGLGPEHIHHHPPAEPDEMVRLSAAYDVGLALEQPVSVNRDICLTNKLFVYLLAGNALLASRTTGQAAFLAPLADAAQTYAPANVDELAAALGGWIRDRDSLDQARRAAWRWGGERYNWDHESATFLEVVQSAMASAETLSPSTPPAR